MDLSNSTSVTGMFNNCHELKNIDIEGDTFDCSKSTTFNSMFVGCNQLTRIPRIILPTNVNYTMQSTFQGCSNLEEVP